MRSPMQPTVATSLCTPRACGVPRPRSRRFTLDRLGERGLPRAWRGHGPHARAMRDRAAGTTGSPATTVALPQRAAAETTRLWFRVPDGQLSRPTRGGQQESAANALEVLSETTARAAPRGRGASRRGACPTREGEAARPFTASDRASRADAPARRPRAHAPAPTAVAQTRTTTDRTPARSRTTRALLRVGREAFANGHASSSRQPANTPVADGRYARRAHGHRSADSHSPAQGHSNRRSPLTSHQPEHVGTPPFGSSTSRRGRQLANRLQGST